MEYRLKGLLFHLNFISIFENKTLFTFGSMCDGNLVSVCIIEQAFILFQWIWQMLKKTKHAHYYWNIWKIRMCEYKTFCFIKYFVEKVNGITIWLLLSKRLKHDKQNAFHY